MIDRSQAAEPISPTWSIQVDAAAILTSKIRTSPAAPDWIIDREATSGVIRNFWTFSNSNRLPIRLACNAVGNHRSRTAMPTTRPSAHHVTHREFHVCVGHRGTNGLHRFPLIIARK
jgi:hypothetical protein